MNIDTCDKCKYFEESIIVPDGGVCHRNPPTAMFGMTPEGPRPMGSAFAPTMKNSWCGEWKKGSLIKLSKNIPPDPQPSSN